MEAKDFSQIVEDRFTDVRETLTGKAKEYARLGDRFANFKTAAAFNGTSPETALWGMHLKHLASLRDFIHDLERDVHMPWKSWDEKIRDVIAYALLLEGLIQERYPGSVRHTPNRERRLDAAPRRQYYAKQRQLEINSDRKTS